MTLPWTAPERSSRIGTEFLPEGDSSAIFEVSRFAGLRRVGARFLTRCSPAIFYPAPGISANWPLKLKSEYLTWHGLSCSLGLSRTNYFQLVWPFSSLDGALVVRSPVNIGRSLGPTNRTPLPQ